jgi:excisionase family DNA binding protein
MDVYCEGTLTADEAAMLLKTNKQHLLRLARSGQVLSFKLGKHVRFPISELMNLVADEAAA